MHSSDDKQYLLKFETYDITPFFLFKVNNELPVVMNDGHYSLEGFNLNVCACALLYFSSSQWMIYFLASNKKKAFFIFIFFTK